MDLVGRVSDELTSLAWLEEAIEHAYTHEQMKSLAYLEAVMEDVMFVIETTGQKSFTVG